MDNSNEMRKDYKIDMSRKIDKISWMDRRDKKYNKYLSYVFVALILSGLFGLMCLVISGCGL